jgi:LuxR family quorum-sensing system transcriptional regulator SolR
MDTADVKIPERLIQSQDLESWNQKCLSMLSGHDDEHSIFKQAVLLANELGFDYLGFGIQLQGPVSLRDLIHHLMSYLDIEIAEPNKTIVLLDNHPPGAMEIFKKRFSQTDPLIKHARTSTEIVVWNDKLFAGQGDRWKLMNGIGMCHGLSLPSRSRTGSVALANFSRRENDITPEELAAKKINIGILTGILHAEVEIKLLNKLLPEVPDFDDLDRAILRWTARGKTATEIAQIMNIKERGITARKAAITEKLQAKTFAQAMLIAFSLGLMN